MSKTPKKTRRAGVCHRVPGHCHGAGGAGHEPHLRREVGKNKEYARLASAAPPFGKTKVPSRLVSERLWYQITPNGVIWEGGPGLHEIARLPPGIGELVSICPTPIDR